MPDGSTFPTLSTAQFPPLPPDAGAFEVMVRKADIGREQNRLWEIGTRENDHAASALAAGFSDAWSEALDRILDAPLHTVPDAIAVLLAASHDLRDAVNEDGRQAEYVPSYLALGRVLNFLMAKEGISRDVFNIQEQEHPLDGADPKLAAAWFIDRALRAGGAFLMRRGALALYFSELDDDASEMRGDLLREFALHDRKLVKDRLRNAASWSPEYSELLMRTLDTEKFCDGFDWMFTAFENHWRTDIHVQHIGKSPWPDDKGALA